MDERTTPVEEDSVVTTTTVSMTDDEVQQPVLARQKATIDLRTVLEYARKQQRIEDQRPPKIAKCYCTQEECEIWAMIVVVCVLLLPVIIWGLIRSYY